VSRPTGRALRLGVAAGLACLLCCLVELGLVGGLGVLSIGVEFTELARLAPLLGLATAAVATVLVLRRRRRRSHTRPVPLSTPRVRQHSPLNSGQEPTEESARNAIVALSPSGDRERPMSRQ